MHDPNSDPDDISGARDDAPMETKSTTGPRELLHTGDATEIGR